MKTLLQEGSEERYVSLQRKLEHLERVHSEGKRSQQSELTSAKADLLAAQRASADLTFQLDKIKKHSCHLEVRWQELRQTALADQAELKDLRSKLRLAEAERAQLVTRQGDKSDAKRALHALESRCKQEVEAAESKRREEVRDRDRRIAELEKALVGEKRRRETAEARTASARGKSDGQVERAQARTQTFETELQDARAVNSQLRAQLQDVEWREMLLVERLQAYQTLLTQTADAYGRLVAHTVTQSTHDELKQAYYALELRTFRLERKVSNGEAQVAELVQLIRQAQEEKFFALSQLREAETERAFYISAYQELAGAISTTEPSFPADLSTAQIDSIHLDRDIADMSALGYRSLAQYYFLMNRELMQEYRSALNDLTDDQVRALTQKELFEKEVATRTALYRELQQARDDLSRAHQEHEDASVQLRDTKADVLELRGKADMLRREKLREVKVHEQTLRREKEATHKLAMSVQMHKIAEDALRAETEQLAAELVDAGKYQEAYYALSDEVANLTARNALAEDEATRISQLNAEILSNNNPAQRVIYLDRIRRELAETKQALVNVTQDREQARVQVGTLLQELAVYKSVAIVPGSTSDYRPKTTITRVVRAPLASHSLNEQPSGTLRSSSTRGYLAELLSDKRDDMTLDEIM